MVPGRVSIIIPSRNEQFHLADGTFHDLIGNTVRDLHAHAKGDIEIISVLDGYWPDPALPDLPNLVVLHKGQAGGMRPAINDGALMASGEFLMKLDGHCSLSDGFDLQLKADYADNRDWLMVPRRDRLDADTWGLQVTGKPPIDYHYLSYPFERPNDPSCGMHGTIWTDRIRARANNPDYLIDDEMSSQGSCWFAHRDHWNRIGPMEIDKYGNFIQEFQELGLKTWLGGGAVKINKKVTYLHLHKGKRFGRGYFISKNEMQGGADFATSYWMNDRWAERKHDLRWLIEKFAPVPTWPKDLDEAFRHLKKD